MSKYLNLNHYQKEALLLALLLQIEHNGKQAIVNEQFVRKAQQMIETAGRGKAFDWAYNPLGGTLELHSVKPQKQEKQLSFSDLLEQLTGESRA